jgi:hypothetical protein
MHFYDEKGKPQHFQVTKTGKNAGKLRPSTMADARKHNLRASVTGITGIMDSGSGLTNWLIREAIKKFTIGVYKWFPDSDAAMAFGVKFKVDLHYVERDYAAEGSVIHDKIETWIKAGMGDTDCPHCLAAKEVFEKYGVTKPITEASFATSDYGGAVDIHCKEQDIVIDWKTKDGNLTFKTAKSFIYDTHSMQLTAYREGLGLTKDARLVNVFLSRTDAGTWCDYEHKPEEVVRGWEMFKACLVLWKLKNKV